MYVYNMNCIVLHLLLTIVLGFMAAKLTVEHTIEYHIDFSPYGDFADIIRGLGSYSSSFNHTFCKTCQG
jgi:hypothetical protein